MPIVQISQSSILNGVTSGDQTDPQTIRWEGGSVATYTSVEGGVAVIRLATFNHEGERIGSDIVVSQVPSTDNMSTAFLGRLSNGTIIVTWVDVTTGEAFFRAYDGTTLAPLNAPTEITQTSAVDATFSGIGFAEAANGNVLFSWTTTEASGDGAGLAVHARMLSADLSTFESEFQLNSTTTGDQARARVSQLGNGNFLVTFQTNDSGTDDIRGRIIDQNGDSVGNDFVINGTTAGDQQRARARQLDDGRTLIVHESNDGGSDVNIRMRLLDLDGVPIGADEIVNTTTTGNQRAPNLIVLPDGRVAISWSSFEVSGSGGTQVVMRARIWDPDGLFPESDFNLGQFPTTNSIPFTSLRATEDGRLVLAVGTPSLSLDGSGLSTELRYFVPTTDLDEEVANGTTGPDPALIGTSLTTSWIDGLAGDDSIEMAGTGRAHFYGDAGNDTLIGSWNTDTLYGGTGNDQLSGAANADILAGETGNDMLDGGAGGDVLDGGDGFDFVSYLSATSGLTVNLSSPDLNTGDAFLDAYEGIEGLVGSSGNDNLTGTSGNDVIYSALGNDIMYGLQGNDTLLGQAGSDIFFGGEGNDFMSGVNGAEVDVNIFVFNVSQYYGFGQDTIVGFDANDASPGHDVLYISSAVFADFAAMEASTFQFGTATVIFRPGSSDWIKLVGVDKTTLTAGDVVFF
ncbi:MAG TPA: calcium-binding protein [Hyphomicrobiaceae bacterium]|nr:calcium-binding protein [Hyphomicrobiaceae bacterium]